MGSKTERGKDGEVVVVLAIGYFTMWYLDTVWYCGLKSGPQHHGPSISICIQTLKYLV